MKDQRIERYKSTIGWLYKQPPLVFSAKEFELDSLSYKDMMSYLMPKVSTMHPLLGMAPRTNSPGISQPSNWTRRSLEDMFLLAKSLISNPSVYDVAKISFDLLSSNFCWDTGLRVYMFKEHYTGHRYGYLGIGEFEDRGFATSLLQDKYSDLHPVENSILMCDEGYYYNRGSAGYFNDSQAMLEEIKIAEEWVRSQPDFAPVGAQYRKKELMQSL